MSGPHTAWHRAGVARLVAAGARAVGFVSTLRATCGVDMELCGRFVPDAFMIDTDRRAIVVFEVIVRHDLSEQKLRRVRSLRDRLTAIGWTLELHAVFLDDEPRQVDLTTGRTEISMEELREAIDGMGASR